MEGVQAVLLSAHGWVVACWSLVGHVLNTSRAQWAGGRRSREGHIQVANRLFTLAYCCVSSSWAGTRKLDKRKKKQNKKLRQLSASGH